MATGMGGVMKLSAASHSGMTAEEFAADVRDWLAKSKPPETGRLDTEMVFQPMLDLLDYLRGNDFIVYIVSGGGIDFLRVFSEDVYGDPPKQVVGTTLDAEFEMRDGIPTIVTGSGVSLVDDRASTPVGIYRHVGRRPADAAVHDHCPGEG